MIYFYWVVDRFDADDDEDVVVVVLDDEDDGTGMNVLPCANEPRHGWLCCGDGLVPRPRYFSYGSKSNSGI